MSTTSDRNDPRLTHGGAVRVIGIDPSLTATGIARAGGRLLVVGGPAKHGDTRLAFIHQEIERVVRLDKPDLAVVEDLPTHAHAAGILGMVQGVVRLALIRDRVPYALVTAATLKKYATGRGDADKADMRVALLRRADVDERDNNLVDAFFLRAAGLQRLGEPVLRMPADQVKALDKVEWPAVAREEDEAS